MRFNQYLNEWTVIYGLELIKNEPFEMSSDILFLYFTETGLWWAKDGIAYHENKRVGKLKKIKMDKKFRDSTGVDYIYDHEGLENFIDDNSLYTVGRIKGRKIIVYDKYNKLNDLAIDAIYKYIPEN